MLFAAWPVRSSEIHSREEALRQRLRVLADEDRKRFYSAYQRKLRDPDTYAVLNWFFLTGLHHFYLGEIFAGTMNLALMLGGVVLLPISPSVGVGLVVFVLAAELPALFRSQAVVAHHNVRLGEQVLRSLGFEAVRDSGA